MGNICFKRDKLEISELLTKSVIYNTDVAKSPTENNLLNKYNNNLLSNISEKYSKEVISKFIFVLDQNLIEIFENEYKSNKLSKSNFIKIKREDYNQNNISYTRYYSRNNSVIIKNKIKFRNISFSNLNGLFKNYNNELNYSFLGNNIDITVLENYQIDNNTNMQVLKIIHNNATIIIVKLIIIINCIKVIEYNKSISLLNSNILFDQILENNKYDQELNFFIRKFSIRAGNLVIKEYYKKDNCSYITNINDNIKYNTINLSLFFKSNRNNITSKFATNNNIKINKSLFLSKFSTNDYQPEILLSQE